MKILVKTIRPRISFPDKELYKKTIVQLFRYGIVGLCSNGIGYCCYLLITWLGLEPKVAMTLLYGVGALVSFFCNRSFTFSHKGGLRSAGLRYMMAHLMGYGINYAFLFFFVDQLGYAHEIVQAVAVFVVAFFLFISFKLFVFRIKTNV